MLWRAVFTLLLVGESLGGSNFSFFRSRMDKITYPTKLHCIYSRYMLYYFKLNAFVFKNTFGVSIDESDDFGEFGKKTNVEKSDLDFYDERLRSQGHIVLAMLDELRNLSPDFTPPHDLMQVNLYLNNMSGTTLVNAIGPGNEEPSYISGYKFFHKKMTDALMTFIWDGHCRYNKKNTIVRDKMCFTLVELRKINKLLADEWPLKTVDVSDVLTILDKNKTKLEVIFESTFNKDSYKDFKSENLLYLPLLGSDFKHLNIEEPASLTICKSDDLYTVRNVITNIRHCIVLNITMFDGVRDVNPRVYDLLVTFRALFHQNSIITFQQIVMGAALYPVFVCLGMYLTVLKKLHSGGNESQNDHILMGDNHENLIKHLGTLIELDIFPSSAQEYLSFVVNETVKVIKEFLDPSSKTIDDINFILGMIHSSMEFCYIEYDIKNIPDFKKASDIINFFEAKINNVGLYVESLSHHRDTLHKAHNIYKHNTMFKYKHTNSEPLGYYVTNSKIDHDPIIRIYNS